MESITTNDLTNLAAEIAGPRQELNTILAVMDFHADEIKIQLRIWVLARQLRRSFEKYKATVFADAYAHVLEMLDRIFHEGYSLEKGIQNIMNLLNPVDEALDYYLSRGEIIQEHMMIIREQFDDIIRACTVDVVARKYASAQAATAPVPALDVDLALLTGKFDDLKTEEADLLSDFIGHASEIISQTEDNFLVLETNPADESLINDIFRGIHTLKGDSGFLNLKEIQTISHAFETLLGKCRNRTLEVTSERISFFLQTLETIKRLMNNLSQKVKLLKKEIKSADIADVDIAGVLEGLNRMTHGQEPVTVAPPPAAGATPDMPVAGVPGKIETDAVRVPQKKIEYAEEMIGELMITMSLLRQNAGIRSVRNRDAIEKFDQLEMTVEQLQSTILKMKMYPVGSIYTKLSRMVRDTGKSLNKKIDFVPEGSDVEIDKSVIDEIYSPLMHIIRNSIDHGIEQPDVREKAGKPQSGTIRLSAENVGDNVVLTIKDDGAGLNREKILSKAKSRNLIAEGDVLTDTEIFHLIFAPGFSTAEKVTDISGRGVGMDVVRTTVEKLGGNLMIASEEGEGTKITIKLPLSSSIIEGLVCAVGESRFIFPMIKILYTLTPELNAIQYVYEKNGLFIMFEGASTPIVELGDFYSVREFEKNPEKAVTIVIEYHGRRYGIMVDEIIGMQKIVTKSFKDRFQNICGLKSGTILGDGNVGFIIEPDEIINEHFAGRSVPKEAPC